MKVSLDVMFSIQDSRHIHKFHTVSLNQQLLIQALLSAKSHSSCIFSFLDITVLKKEKPYQDCV